MLVKKDAQFFLILLDCFITELRSVEERDVEDVCKLAYILHNVPSMLRQTVDDEAAETAFKGIQGLADYWVLGTTSICGSKPDQAVEL